MVLLYNDKTVVDVPDCKMMKIWLGQNFLIGTAPRSLDKRHGQVSKVSEKSDFLFQRL